MVITELLQGIEVKAKIVAEDEFEHSTRKYLNFGHTFGHAVEACMWIRRFKPWRVGYDWHGIQSYFK